MKEYNMSIFATRHFLKRMQTRVIDLAPIADIYAKASGTKIEETIVSENQHTRIVAARISPDKILLLTAHVVSHKTRSMEDFKRTHTIVRYSQMFLEKINKKGIDLSAIVDVLKKASQTKAGNDIIGENKTTKIIAHKTSSIKVVLITVYRIPQEQTQVEEDFTEETY